MAGCDAKLLWLGNVSVRVVSDVPKDQPALGELWPDGGLMFADIADEEVYKPTQPHMLQKAPQGSGRQVHVRDHKVEVTHGRNVFGDRDSVVKLGFNLCRH